MLEVDYSLVTLIEMMYLADEYEMELDGDKQVVRFRGKRVHSPGV